MLVEYHNLYIHFVLKTLHRLPLIPLKAKPRIERYISGIIKNCNSRMYAIYANLENVHILISISPAISANELIIHVAFSTEQFIKKNQLLPQSFAWQEKCSAFTVSKSAVPGVIKIHPESSGASQEDLVSGRMQAVSGGDECSSTEVACGDLLTEVACNNQVLNQVGVCHGGTSSHGSCQL